MGEFLLAVLVCLAIAYAPGYILLRAIACSRIPAAVLAPLAAVPVYVILGIALQRASISIPGMALFGSVLLIAVAVYALSCGIGLLCAKRKAPGAVAGPAGGSDAVADCGSGSQGGRPLLAEMLIRPAAHLQLPDRRFAKRALALFVGVAFIITCLVFFSAIGTPDSFGRNDDTTVHLSMTRAFMDTGTYSTIHVNSFMEHADIGGYYPAAWHILAAIVSSAIGGAVIIATNAQIFIFTSVAFPSMMCLLFLRLFEGCRRIVLAGSLFCVMFAVFPWGFLMFGQLLSNLASFSMLPGAMFMVVSAFNAGDGRERACAVAGVLAGLASIVFFQPNGAFTFGIWAVGYSIGWIFYRGGAAASASPKRVVVAASVLVLACAAWAACLVAPPLHSVVGVVRDNSLTLPQGIASALVFMYSGRIGIQLILSIPVLVGVIVSLKERRYLWMTAVFILADVQYIAAMSISAPVKNILSGFWFSDPIRCGAMAAIFAVPVAALGFARIYEWLAKRLPKVDGKAIAAVLVAVVIAVQCVPFRVTTGSDKRIENGLLKVRDQIRLRYSWHRGYTADEREFVQRVIELIGNDALVINSPHDGSLWAYGTDDINVHFRRMLDDGMNATPPAVNELLRMHLDEVAQNEDVRQALRDLDARYLMFLDEKGDEDDTWAGGMYYEDRWVGIESVTPDTPGFTLLLEDGDKRLYRIDY